MVYKPDDEFIPENSRIHGQATFPDDRLVSSPIAEKDIFIGQIGCH